MLFALLVCTFLTFILCSMYKVVAFKQKAFKNKDMATKETNEQQKLANKQKTLHLVLWHSKVQLKMKIRR